MIYYNRLDVRSSYCAVRKGVVGREDFAQTFVLYAVGTNTDKRFAHVYPREELPSFTIELLLSVAILRRALKSLKRGFDVGFIVVRFFR